MGDFERDLDLVLERLGGGLVEGGREQLRVLKERLVQLHETNVVKINHSVMELVCARYLVLRGYDVVVEQALTGGLICDLFSVRGMGTMILEVETGFVPPKNALNPLTYRRARITSKIARYSPFANKFGLASPPNHVLQIPSVFLKPPGDRSWEELSELKSLCDRYYKSPPLTLEELRYGLLHTVYIINVDEGQVREVDPTAYRADLPSHLK
jgi:hypothetical protein